MRLQRVRFFPNYRRESEDYRYRVVVGIGGNEGDVKRRFVKLFRLLQNDRRFFVQETSPILKNPPFGYMNQPDFYNAVMVVQTSLCPREFLKIALHIEQRFKRVRYFKNGPRTLDLDIIFFNNKTIKQPHLIVPHPKWQERVSGTIPLLMLKCFKGER